jgi:chromosome segregation ATPase
MSDIVEYERRIAAALDRIAKSAAGRTNAAPEGADIDLVEELEVERATNARLVTSREKNVARIERLETRVMRMTDRLEAADVENRRLQNVIAALRDNNAKLRDANAEHQGAGETVNAALAAELDNLKAARSADLAELDDILAQMAPMMKEA